MTPAEASPAAESPKAPQRGAAPGASTARLARRPALFAPLLFAAAALVFWLARPAGRDERFEIDEAEWLAMSIHDARQIAEGRSPFEGLAPSPYHDLAGDPWKVGIHQSTFGFMNPMLPKLVFGSVCLALGHEDYDPAVYPRFAKELPPARAERAAEVVRPALVPVRFVVLALAALSAMLVYLAVLRAAGLGAALASYGFFVASPNVIDHATRIRTDFFPIAFALAGLALALARARALAGCRGTKQQLGSAAALGLLAGLSAGSKLNGALLALLAGVWICVPWLARRRECRVGFARGPLASWLVAGALCLGVFALFVPHLWTDPVADVRELLAKWEGDLEHQKGLYGERLGRADTPAQHLALAARVFEPQSDPLARLAGFPVGAWLAAAGLVVLSGASVRALRSSRGARSLSAPAESRPSHATGSAELLAFVFVLGLGTALWIPFGRDNFFLALAPVVAVLEGMALGWALAALARVVRRAPRERSTA